MNENDPLPALAERKSLSLSSIRTDGGTQARDGLAEDVVDDYARLIRDGKKLPPLKVVWDGSVFWLWDGFHTYHAAQMAGKRSWPCEITAGNLSLARVLAASANQSHGLRRTNTAKRRAVEMLVAERPDWSLRSIAEHCGVSHDLVHKVRKASPQVSDSDTCPESRTGRDGKSYPASPARKDEAQPVEEAQPEPFELPRTEPPGADSPAAQDTGLPGETGHAPQGPDPDPDPPPDPTTPAPAVPVVAPEAPAPLPAPTLDAVGLAIPDERLITWNARDRFAGILSLLRQAQRQISDLAQSDGGQVLRTHCELHAEGDRQTLKLDRVTSAIRQVESARPHAMTCPYCHQSGRTVPSCKACQGRGWVTKSTWENAPADYRQSLEGAA